jgi:hypothetical protein
MMSLIKSSIGTKFVSTWSDLMCKLALDAVRCVAVEEEGTGKTEVDIKRYARVEKVNKVTPFTRVSIYSSRFFSHVFRFPVVKLNNHKFWMVSS